MPSLESLTIGITGASEGIGAAIARRLAKARLFLFARSTERLSAVAAGLPNAEAITLDINQRSELERIISALPVPDVWVNNAGLAIGQATLDQADAADIDHVLNVNVHGTLHATRLVMAGMRARGSGHIVNITSAAAFNPYKGGNAYAISKAALHMATQCLRHDLGGTPIRVTEIAPGIVGDTVFSKRRFAGDPGRGEKVSRGMNALTPEDVAETVHFSITLPPHVNIDLIQMYPVQQHGGGGRVHRSD